MSEPNRVPFDREAWEERAAIAEFDGQLPREQAEQLAWAEDDRRRAQSAHRPAANDPALAELRILYDQHRRNLEDAGIVRGVPRVRLSDWLAALGSDGRAMVDRLVEAGRVTISDLFVAEVSP
ncbi:MAG TPA: hypothetical protein PLX26_15720 [Candidatus Competibacteraceae bacterium]|nr:hypothetical protein [Candidatus Competibacteraceae bacterium]